MTVGIAALFQWNYATRENPDYGIAAITLSDRMITAGDVEYEPQQKKIAYLSRSTVVLIAGDYSVHMQAIYKTTKNLDGRDLGPAEIARLYGRSIQDIKLQEAEDLYLSPLGLNTETFFAQQKELDADFTESIKRQMQNFRGQDVEALVVGSDGNSVHIYAVDSNGSVSCADGVGFAAVGIGAWHAKSQLMQVGYVNAFQYPIALAATYAAKKAAEIAPGVGGATDIHLAFKDGVVPLFQETFSELDRLYQEYTIQRRMLESKSVAALNDFIASFKPIGPDDGKGTNSSGESKESDGGTRAPTTETARSNEDRTRQETAG